MTGRICGRWRTRWRRAVTSWRCPSTGVRAWLRIGAARSTTSPTPWTRFGALAEPYGADRRQITWAGHSAGGHLGLWAAARPYFPADSPWRGRCDARHVVSLAGCSSLGLCAEWNLGDGAAQNLLGGTPAEVPERYAAADPAGLTPPSVPVTFVHGTADDRVPVQMSRVTHRGRLVEIDGADHFDLIDPHSRYWPQVLAASETMKWASAISYAGWLPSRILYLHGPGSGTSSDHRLLPDQPPGNHDHPGAVWLAACVRR